MGLRIGTLLVILFGAVYAHTTYDGTDDLTKIISMISDLQSQMKNLQTQQQELKVKMMDSQTIQNEKLSNFDGKIKTFQDSLTEQLERIQVGQVGTINNYYGCDNSANEPPTEPQTTTTHPTEPPLEPQTTTHPTTNPITEPLTTSPTTEPPVTIKAQDCMELYEHGVTLHGVYTIYPGGGEPLQVYCEMDDGGWTVIQKRSDDTIDYAKNMAEYAQGFGDVAGEHWLGLDAMHNLTEQGNYIIRFDLESFDNETAWAEYIGFNVSEGTDYTLTFDEDSYRGTAGNSLSVHNEAKFSTLDMDQDSNNVNCATFDQEYGWAGWWYISSGCSYVTTTGMARYSIQWTNWKGRYDALKSAVLKIKRV